MSLVFTFSNIVAGDDITFNTLNGTGNVDWGDGTSSSFDNSSPTHTYSDMYDTIIITITSNDLTEYQGFSGKLLNNLNSFVYEEYIDTLISFGNSSYSAFFGVQTNFTVNFNNFTSNVTSMNGMFEFCPKFNNSLNTLDTSSVTNMTAMFLNCSNFNQALFFDTSNVTTMLEMFAGCTNFNQAVNFDTSNVINMSVMFSECTNFNQAVNFDTSNVTNMSTMCNGCTNFNQAVNFDTSNVTNMSNMFSVCTNFNQAVNFDTKNVTNMSQMFEVCTNFNQAVNFNTQNVTNMDGMFYLCVNFNQVVPFYTQNVISMIGMFQGCTNFNQDISSFSIASLLIAEDMLDNTGMSSDNYSNLLIAWNAYNVENIVFGASNLQYNANAVSARNNLINNLSWTITDSGITCILSICKILTSRGYVQIKDINNKDIIISENNKELKIKMIVKNEYELSNKKALPYKISKGQLSASEDIYLSSGHAVKYNEVWKLPKNWNMERMTEKELIDLGLDKIIYYHIEIDGSENRRVNTLICSGVVIESFSDEKIKC